MDKLKEKLFKTQHGLHMISAYIKKISEEDNNYFSYFFDEEFKNKIYTAEEALGDLIIYTNLRDEFKEYKKEQVKNDCLKMARDIDYKDIRFIPWDYQGE